MKRCALGIVVVHVIFALFADGIISLGHCSDTEPSYGADIGAIALHTRSDDQWSNSVFPGAQVFSANSNEDRGCCVLFTPAPKCVYTNRSYCGQKAREANIRFEFYTNKSCKDVGECR